MSEASAEKQPRTARTWWRMLIAVGLGLLGSAIIWIATPYNNYYLNNSPIADDYLPIGAVFIVLLLVLGINPMLRWLRGPAGGLSRSQLAVILAIMLVACAIPGQGLLRMLPYMTANAPRQVSQDRFIAQQYEQMDQSPEQPGIQPLDKLFPDQLQAGAQTPVSENFIHKLPAGQSVPWMAWVQPLVYWGVFLLFSWMMMIGLSLIVLPQWRNNERLAFPLVAVEQPLIEQPKDGRLFSPLFRSRAFWIGTLAVFVIHLLGGAQVYFPERAPAVPIQWDLTQLMASEPWRHIPQHLRAGKIYFVFVGIAFFMPNRISFSIWFTIVAYGFYRMIGIAYLPPFHHGTMADHRTGAMIAMTLFILYLGRSQWAAVARSLLARPRNPTDRRNRSSGWMFLLGLAGMGGWLRWVGVEWFWVVALVAFAFMIALLISRVVAETGMPFMRLQADATYLMKLSPLAWLSPVALYFSTVVTVLFPIASRVNVTAMSTQAMALDDQAGPTTQRRMGYGFLGLLVVGLLIAGAAHLYMNYHHDTPASGQGVINPWGGERLTPAHNAITELRRGQVSQPLQNAPAHIAFGATLAAVLYYLSINFPTWPLHPIGLLLVDTTTYGNAVWTSIFLGWLVKMLLLSFGGAAIYRAARSVFLGVIMGEILAAVFWAAVPVVVPWFDVTPKVFEILPG